MTKTGYTVATLFVVLVVILSTKIAAQNWPPTITIRGQEYRVATYDQIRDLGLETTYVAMIRNAAVDYIEAMNLYPEIGDRDSVLSSQFDHVISNEWLPEFEELDDWLKRCEPMMEPLRRAYGKRRCVWPVFASENSTTAWGVGLFYVQEMRWMARVLVLRAKHALANGNYETAKESFDIVFRMSEHFKEDPFLISGLIGTVCRATAMTSLRDLVLRGAFTQQQMEEILEMVIPYVEEPLTCQQVMAREEKQGLTMIRLLLDVPHGGHDVLGLKGMKALPLEVLHQANKISPVPRIACQSHLRGYWREFNRILSLPYHEQLRATINAENHDDEESWNVIDWLIPAVWRAREKFARVELAMNVLELTLAMEIYKKKHGEYPDRLNRLFGIIREIPLDPFSGDDLIYRPGEDGYVLYSVGTNQIDDGGQPPEGDNPWGGEDFVFTSTARPIAPYEPAEEDDNTTPR